MPFPASSATWRPRAGGALDVRPVGDDVDGRLAEGELVGGVVFQAGLPLLGEHRSVTVREVTCQELPDLCPHLIIAENFGRVQQEGVVGERELR